MTPTKVPYLCGGILFSLILQARKTRTKARDKYHGGSDGLKDTDVMMGLVEVVTGDSFVSSQGKTFGKCTTQFKTCQDYGTTYIPFTDSSVISSFTSSVKQKDPDLLKRMSGFINKYINEVRSEWLVKALFEVIQNDNEIDSNTTFAVSSKNEISKKDMDSIHEVELPVFLLSVLSFILNERKDNSKGRPTFESWHTQSGPQAPWKYKADVGASIERSITVNIECEPTEPEIITTDISDSLVTEILKKSATERINDKILAAGQALADTWGNAMENLADELDDKTTAEAAPPKLIIDNLCEQDTIYLKQFRAEAKPILKYCIENDPSAGETKLILADEISDLIRHWQFEYREIEDIALRLIVKDAMQVLGDYTYYISDKFLRLIPDRGVLWFRNESWEEGEQLRNVLRPETIKKRYEMRDLYLRLYPLPENEEPSNLNTTVIQQQTNVVQNGDNNINLTNNGTINIKL